MGNSCARLALRGATYANTRPDTLDSRELPVLPIKVNDGDTLWVAALTGPKTCCWPTRQRLHIRAMGYDSPELHPSCAKTDPAYALEVAAAQHAKLFFETLLKDKRVTARFGKREKYGRHLAELFVDGKSVTQAMIAAGHAVPYFGGKKDAFRAPTCAAK